MVFKRETLREKVGEKPFVNIFLLNFLFGFPSAWPKLVIVMCILATRKKLQLAKKKFVMQLYVNY